MKNLLGRESKGLAAWLIAVLAIGGLTTSATADQSEWFSAMSEQPAAVVNAEMEAAPAEESTKMIPWLTINVDYALVSDYVWRGIQLSDYAGEDGDDPNHQLGINVEVDLAQVTGVEMLGSLGANVWFEWFAGQEQLEPNVTSGSNNNLQEVDYTLYYTHSFADWNLTVTGGWIAYHFPRLRDSGLPTGDAEGAYTQEIFLTLEWDDAMIFGESMFNPWMSYYLDVDEVDASVILIGVYHDFALSQWCPDTVVLKDTTVTPSATLMIDHRYYDKAGLGGVSRATGTRLGYMEYGLSASVDLNSALGIPSQYGSFSVGGFMNYVMPFHDEDSNINDQLYGGMTIGWEF